MTRHTSPLLTTVLCSMLWLSGCGYNLVGMKAKPEFTVPRVLLTESVSENTALLRALVDLNYQLVSAKDSYSYKIVDADCDSFSIEDTGGLQAIDLNCTLAIGESLPESREFSRRQVVTIGNSNERIRGDDVLEAQTNLYTDLLRRLN